MRTSESSRGQPEKTPRRIKEQIPSVYFREEKERGRKLMQETEQNEKPLYKKRAKSRSKHHHEPGVNELLKRGEKATTVSIEFGRPTRSSSLKSACARRATDIAMIELRRESLNDEMRREREIRVSKRIQPVIDQLRECNAIMAKSLFSKKEELRRQELEWQRWLELTEQTNEMREPMLKRLFL